MENNQVTITILGAGGQALAGSVIGGCGSTLKIAVPAAIADGTAVKIEAGDILLLGEVRGSDVEGVTVKIVHALHSLSQLESLNRALLGTDALREEPADAPIVVRRY